MRGILVVVLVILLGGCATVAPQPRYDWSKVDPITLKCLGEAMHSGAYDKPSEDCK